MPESGPCNRCGAHKGNILGLCGACGRFPAPLSLRNRERAYGKTKRQKFLETVGKFR